MTADVWRHCTVVDIAAPLRNAIVGGPFGSDLVSRDYVSQGVPVIRGANMGRGRWVSGEFVYVTPEKADSLSSNCAKPGDLIFTQRGTLGQVALVPIDGSERYLISQSQMKLTVDPEKVDRLFMYYVFTSEEQQEYIRNNAIQTGVPHTNLGILKNTPIRIPSLDKQREIAKTLGALDDKIELLQGMNLTLEVMAESIFKSWFVDFDPVRAKAEGREPEGMSADIAALFPSEFVDSEMGPIPKGWEVSCLGHVAEVVDCLHSKKPEILPVGRPFIQLSAIRNDGLLDKSKVDSISEDDYRKWVSRIEVEAGDCVITNVGRVGAVSQIPADYKAAMGRNMTAIRLKPFWKYPTFLIELLLSDAMRSEIDKGTDVGTILNALNVRNIPKLRFVLPSKLVVEAFEESVRPLRRQMETGLERAATLSELRDHLLPALLSGRIGVDTKDIPA